MSPVRPIVKVIGVWLEPEHHRLRDFLTRVAQPYEWLEAGTPEAERLLGERGLVDPSCRWSSTESRRYRRDGRADRRVPGTTSTRRSAPATTS